MKINSRFLTFILMIILVFMSIHYVNSIQEYKSQIVLAETQKETTINELEVKYKSEINSLTLDLLDLKLSLCEAGLNSEIVQELDKFIYMGEFQSTAYTLRQEECSKAPTSKWYGITCSGYDLKDKTREQAMCIAVDPKVIPLGSKVYVKFDDWRSKYDGIYTAYDTGNAIKDKIVDVFIPELSEAIDFGRVNGVKIWLLEGAN